MRLLAFSYPAGVLMPSKPPNFTTGGNTAAMAGPPLVNMGGPNMGGNNIGGGNVGGGNVGGGNMNGPLAGGGMTVLSNNTNANASHGHHPQLTNQHTAGSAGNNNLSAMTIGNGNLSTSNKSYNSSWYLLNYQHTLTTTIYTTFTPLHHTITTIFLTSSNLICH